MRTHQIRVSDARESVQDIRHRLFTFPEVLEVFATGRSDVLVVVHTGRPRLGPWLAALRAVGYRTPARRDATAPPRSISPEPPEPLADVPSPELTSSPGIVIKHRSGITAAPSPRCVVSR
jgi:hypothetical protein